ncbi:MAG: T9SS type A sorting domain-containing protein [Bacteroidia bacterium]
MKKNISFMLLGMQLLSTVTKSQTLPVMADTAIHVSLLMEVKNDVVRMAKNPINNALYYATFGGGIYKIINTGGIYSDTLMASAANHYITYLQGIAFRDSNIYLVGNHKWGGSQGGYGLVVRGKFQANGSWIWDTLMHTANYPSASTLYDHAFSSICVSANGDSLYFSSGSRTDHGEVTSYGPFPTKREVGLTTTIYRIPINPPSTIYLPNDSALLAASGYVFCRGVRNSFDLELAPNGDLLGCENSGDRDDPDELNWLRQGRHYGFPWRMGGDTTGMQFPGYNQNTDKLINHACGAWAKNSFYNDPNYPQIPAGTTFTEPVKNYGPDADKFRDSQTGLIRDASNEGTYITSFTSHRSPLGLVFDNAGKLAAPYYKSAFMMNYTEGTLDSSGNVGNGIGPFNDLSQDLLQLALFKDTVSGQYSMNCYRLGWNFINPVDAYLENNVLYIIESHGFTIPGKLYALTFPINTATGTCPFLGKDTTICTGTSLTIIPNLKGQFKYQWSNGTTAAQLTVTPTTTATYWVTINNGITTCTDSILVKVKPKPAATYTTAGPTSFCATTKPLTLTANSGTSFTYKWKKGANYVSGATSQIYQPVATGTYTVEVTNQWSCKKTSTGLAVTLNPLPAATITPQGPTTFCTGGSVVLHANGGTNLAWQWKKGTNIVGILQNYTVAQQGTYKVTVTNTNTSCSKTSAGTVVTVNCRGTNPSLSNNSDIEIDLNPNPASGALSVTFDLNEKQAVVEVVDINGKVVIQKNVSSDNNLYELQLNVTDLAAGVYSLLVKTEKNVFNKKFVKQ